MSLLFSHWKEEKTIFEKYNSIMGGEYVGSEEELLKDIDKGILSNFSSRTEVKELRNLKQQIENNNEIL